MKGRLETDTRERIVDTSIRLFLRTSFKGTSIQHITDRLGMTKAAFYWHFKSKDELLLTIIGRYEKELLERLYEHMNAFEGDFVRKFREYHKFINEYARQNGELCVLFVALSAEMAGSRTEAERKIKLVNKRYHGFIESLLTLGKEQALFPPEYDASLNAHIIMAVHNGILLKWYMDKKEIDGPSMSRAYRDMILYGMVRKTDEKAKEPEIERKVSFRTGKRITRMPT